MKMKLMGRVVGFGLIGMILACLHAIYLGLTAPVPGALYAQAPFILVDNHQTWVVVPASRFGIRQYDLTSDATGYALEQGRVPDWAVRPTLGQTAISRGFGWPLPALTGAEVYANKRMIDAPGYLVRSNQDLMPMRFCAGIIVNSILFGFAAFVLRWVAAKTWSKVYSRRKLGPFACERCGYNMKDSGPTCPECGRHKG